MKEYCTPGVDTQSSGKASYQFCYGTVQLSPSLQNPSMLDTSSGDRNSNEGIIY